MALTKAKIAERIYSETYFTKREAADLLETLLNIIKENLCADQEIKIPGFGSFIVQTKASRQGRNPQTGNKMEIASRKVIKFKAAKFLKEDILKRYVHRIDKNGQENTAVPPRTGTFQALHHFTPKTIIHQEEE